VTREQLERLRWHCRRGLLELDLVLERFMAQYAGRLGAEEAQLLAELLQYPDNDLWEVVSGRSERYDPRHRDIVARLRAAWEPKRTDHGQESHPDAA
jgi:succinate dehydrogenase flavin-adding protein (antitoxin of CptAB toxin-antitoxin module)